MAIESNVRIRVAHSPQLSPHHRSSRRIRCCAAKHARRISPRAAAQRGRRRDAGSRFSLQFAGERIPPLAEVFEALESKLRVNVELKDISPKGVGFEAPVVEVVRQCGMKNKVLFSSFNPFTLRRIRSLAPELPSGLLCAHDLPIYLRRAWFAPFTPHEARHPDAEMTDARLVQWCHARELRVNVWTVDAPDEMRRLIVLGAIVR